MSYSTSSDLYNLFGKDNVRKWADRNNSRNETEIDATISWALAQAKDELDSKLSDSPYQFPVTGTAPALLKRIEGYLAGLLLNESRSITDTEEDKGDLKMIAKRVDRFINGVKFGTIKLVGVTPSLPVITTPFAVNDFPEEEEVI